MLLASATLPEHRRPRLRELLQQSHVLRAIECHDPLSALLASNAQAGDELHRVQFDVLWASGFAHATMLGLPDSELAILERRISAIAEIAAVTSKPILADADTGGDAMAFGLLCRRLEQMGVSGAVVEDKTGAKRTSLADNVHHEMADPAVFVHKIRYAKQTLLSQDFLIFARIESLIAGLGLADALARARAYLQSSADGIVIHSKDRTAAEIVAFMQGYRQLQAELGIEKPLVCIPTAYSHLTGAHLHGMGAKIVIHGNHMIRAAYRGMQLAARSILEHDRSLEADAVCASVDELLQAIGAGASATTPKDSRARPETARRTANE